MYIVAINFVACNSDHSVYFVYMYNVYTYIDGVSVYLKK